MAETASMTPDRVVRVLAIDDDEDDFFLTRDLLEEIPGTRLQVDWEPDWERALESVCRGGHDVYLVDYRLGTRSGLDLIREANGRNCSAPLILLTGQGERELDFAAMQAGAADYLEKSNLDSTQLERAIRYAIQNKQSEEQLEMRVRERTAELAETNAALEREIRERQRAEEALRQIDRRKDEFLATLAHELRNPLAPIRNALEILRLGPNTPDAVERGRKMMDRQVAHMVRLIDDLLDISRITRGKVQLRRERVDFADIVAGAVEGSQPLIDAGQHELTITLPDSPVTIEADTCRLTQVLMNLLNNAAKYMEPKGKIRLAATIKSETLVLSVRDSGIGIPPDVLPHIFEMFSQVDRTRDRSQGGLGIGLSLVRGLVELHGGSVQAFSDGPGKGSEFVVRLPMPGGDKRKNKTGELS
jgi:signal transduction histidine kinase